jgi:hypothetical protein
VELIFETNWQAMKWTDGLLVLREVLVQFLGFTDCIVEEDLVKARD